MSDDVFDATQDNNQDNNQSNYFDKLVGEGKKFQDPEALARGKYEADQFVEDLKRQNQELREDLDKASKVDQLLEEIRSQNKAGDTSTPTSGNPDGGAGDPSDTSSGLTEEQMKALIESTISQRETVQQTEKNLSEVNSFMQEHFGSKAGEFLKSKESEVGLSVTKMKELASENPKAFYRLVGLDTEKGVENQSVSFGGTQLNSESGPSPNANTNKRDFNYYQELRRKNKREYFKPETQQQMFEDRKQMGDAFYGN